MRSVQTSNWNCEGLGLLFSPEPYSRNEPRARLRQVSASFSASLTTCSLPCAAHGGLESPRCSFLFLMSPHTDASKQLEATGHLHLLHRRRLCGGPTVAEIADRCPDVQVTVVDINQARIDVWTAVDLSQLPVYEPGLDAVMIRARGRKLHFSTAAEEAIAAPDMVFISVNTPAKTKRLEAGQASDLNLVVGLLLVRWRRRHRRLAACVAL